MEDFDNSPLVRTDFSDDSAWRSLVKAAIAESPDGFRAELRIVDDQSFDGCCAAWLIAEERDGRTRPSCSSPMRRR